jgi:hypothetical protein
VPAEVLDKIPAPLLPYKPLVLARSVVLTLDVGEQIRAEARLTYADAGQAEDGETAVRTSLYVARELAPRWLAETLGVAPSDRGDLPALVRPLQAALKRATVQRRETVVSASGQLKIDASTVASTVVALRAAEARRRSSNNLKQMALSFHNYNDTYGGIPANAIYSKDGKPLLSWRVAILPFVEQDALFRQFKLDEAWDSPHNKKLLAKMPKLYAPVLGKTKVPYGTFYKVFTGPDTPFNPAAARRGPTSLGARIPASFPDGTSNTILIVEGGEAVPWTKPEDLPYDPKKPLPKLGGLFPEGFHVAMADGSVRLVSRKVSETTLRAAITPAGGEVLGSDW